MLKRGLSLVASIASFAGTWASQPCEPLDCSDWVILEPGFSCNVKMPYPCSSSVYPYPPQCFVSNDDRALDNQGNLLQVRLHPNPTNLCNDSPLTRTEIVSWSASGERILAYVDERCAGPYPGGGMCADLTGPLNRGNQSGNYEARPIRFDPVGGRLLLSFESRSSCQGAVPCGNYKNAWIASLTGFAPLFEILQSYEPASNALSFVVPTHSEGLRAADRFDSYWGRVADLPDFTAAHPMACNVPGDHPPQPGEYLTVPDTSPRPAPGQANYIVTAVTNGNERRFGRKRIGGTMSGRDPAPLPKCP